MLPIINKNKSKYLLSISFIKQAIVLDYGHFSCAFVVLSQPHHNQNLKEIEESIQTEIICLEALPIDSHGEIDIQRLINSVYTENISTLKQKIIADLLPNHSFSMIRKWIHTAPIINSPIDFTIENHHNIENLATLPSSLVLGEPSKVSSDYPITLLDALLQTVRRFPNKSIVCIQADAEEKVVTYQQLYAHAQIIAHYLQKQGLATGVPIILAFDDFYPLFQSLWGCICHGNPFLTIFLNYAYASINAASEKFHNTWQLLDKPYILTSRLNQTYFQQLKERYPERNFQLLFFEDAFSQAHDSVAVLDQELDPASTLFYQLSSGSTGTPKCIIETHHNVLQHIFHSAHFNAYTERDISLNWIMFDHVVPIITYHFRDVVLGCNQIHIATALIVNQPIKWLEYIQTHQVTLTWAPNFGYQLLLDAIQQHPGQIPDFSCIRYFMNAGEQVTPRVMREFAAFLQQQSVPITTIQPAFGMAEVATCMTYNNQFHLLNSFQHPKIENLKGPDPSQNKDIEFIDLGTPIPGCSLRIIDKQQRVLPEGMIGELQIKGTVLSGGYYKNASANRTFHADGWFSTGDLGFIHHAHLYITGREKETIIIRGQNFFCHEIEAVLHTIAGVKSTYCAATSFFNITTATEELLIFFVSDEPIMARNEPLIRHIRQTIFDNFKLQALYIIDIAQPDFPKTSSGKIQRSLLKQRFLAGEYLWKTSQWLNNNLPIYGTRTWLLRQRQTFYRYDPKSITLYNVICPSPYSEDSLSRFPSPLLFDFNQIISFHDYSVCIIPDFYFLTPKTAAFHAKHILKLGQFFEYIAKKETKLQHIVILSKQILQVDPNESNPGYQQGWLLGFLNSSKKELTLPNLVLLDLEGQDFEQDLKLVAEEIQSGCKDDLVAMRQGQRYIMTFLPDNYVPTPTSTYENRLLPNSYYLLVGGTSGIGIEIAKYLINHTATQIILTGSQLRSRTDLQTLFADNPNYLARIHYLKFDAQTDDLGTLLHPYQSNLSGMIYLVGTNQQTPIAKLSHDLIDYHVFNKTRGLEKLCQFAHSIPNPPRLMVFSSIFSFLGPAQFSLYAAANSLCDAACDYFSHHYQLKIQTIRWCPWNGIGMSKGFDYPSLAKHMGFRALDLQTCLRIFDELTHSTAMNLTIGLCRSPNQIPEQDILYDYFEIQAHTKQASQTLAKIKLPNFYDQNHKPIKIIFNSSHTTQVQETDYRDLTFSYLRDIWSKHLKLKTFDSKLHFFELGGDSLTAIQIVMDIRQVFNVVLSVHDFLLCNHIYAVLTLIKNSRIQKKKRHRKQGVLTNYPLSTDQQRLWFQINHGPKETYNVFKIYQVSGQLNAQALLQATENLLQQFPILKTQFVADNQQIYQKIAPYRAQEVLSILPVSCVEHALEHVRAQIKKPFDFSSHHPLLQLVLYTIAPDQHVFVVHIHHLICDEWSLKLLASSLSALYMTEIRGRPLNLKKETLSFYEFSAQQQITQVKPSQAYLKQITHAYELGLPYHPTTEQPKGQLLTLPLGQQHFQKLKQLAKDNKVTPAILLHALYSILLHFYTNQSELNIGIPITYREDVDLKNTFGFLLNLAVIGSQLSNTTMAEHIQQIRKNYFAAQLNKHIPFVELLSHFNGIARSVTTTPLFQAMFVYEDFLNTFSIPKVQFKELTLSNETAKFHINLMIKFPKKDHPLLALEFYSNYLSPEFAQRMLHKMRQLICFYLGHPLAKVADFFQLDAYDLKRIHLVNQYDRTLPNEQTLTQMVQAFLTKKNKFTLQYDQQTFASAMLQQDIIQYAKGIQSRKPAQAKVIAICLPTKYQQTVAILATTSLGYPYLPIQYDEPIARIHKIMTQSSEIGLLTDQNKIGEQEWAVQPILIEPISSQVDPSAVIYQNPKPDASAYIIFTSGTTGQPKGVVISHQAVFNTLIDMIQRFKINKQDVFCMISSISFDLSVFDLFASLYLQTKLILPDEKQIVSARYLFDLATQHKVTIWNSAPGFMRLLINHLKSQSPNKAAPTLPHIRKVLLSGDWVSTELVTDITQYLPNAQIICLGGATEASIWSNYYIADHRIQPHWLSIPYGRALANQTLHVLNTLLHPCPVQVVGKLFIGGKGLAQGYYKNKPLTRSKFIQHPMLGRIYDTGDLAKVTETGIVELLGRCDDQVKIRGYRVEIKEVELAIKSLPGIAQVKVLAIGNRDRKQLVAYLVIHQEDTPLNQLSQYLKSLLPAPMIPHFFIPLPAFPLTTNGKIDQQQLIKLFDEHKQTQQIEPMDTESDVELQIIKTLFKRILHLRRPVGDFENFFELGGDSIAASYFISELNIRLQSNISMTDLFYAPSPLELRKTLFLTPSSAHPSDFSEPCKHQLSNCSLSANQIRLLFLEQQIDMPSPIHNMTLYYEIRGPLHFDHWLQACTEVFGAHKILNVKLNYDSQGQLQQQYESGTHHHTIFDFTALNSDWAAKNKLALQILLTASKKPFDLTKPEKVEMTLIKISDQQCYLLMNAHHMVADGESIKTLFMQINDVYQQLQSNIVPNLATQLQKQLDYFDYVQWLSQFEQTETYANQLKFWQNKINTLAGYRTPKMDDDPSYAGKSTYFTLDTASYQPLKREIANHASSGFIYILTLFKFCLYKLLKNSISIIGTTVSARPKAFESCVGFFANTLPVITQITDEDTFSTLHRKVKQNVLEVLDHQWVSFEKIVNMLPEPRTFNHNPLFQIAFVYLKEITILTEQPTLEVQRLNLHNSTAKFDLTLYVHENPNHLRFEIEYKSSQFTEHFITDIRTTMQKILDLQPIECVS